MKLLSIAAGRRNGNSETLLKEALMGAKEVKGTEVEMMRMLDLDIQQCLGCKVCKRLEARSIDACVVKDDAAWVYDKIMDCDGLIIAAPVWTLMPPGYLRHISDRAMGPYVDVAFRLEIKKMFGDKAKMDERLFKNRSGGFISVGGAPLPNWTSFGLPTLHTITFSPQIRIVDQTQVLRANETFGSVLLDDKAVRQAHNLGRHVAEAMGKKWEEMTFKGEHAGTCPVCHLDMMVINTDQTVTCAVCGINGDIKIEGGKAKIVFSREEQAKSVLELEGKRIHFYEIAEVRNATVPRVNEIPAKMEKYKDFITPLKPPKREK